MPAVSLQDERWMRHALELAKRGLGNVFPNPAVGCIIVKDDIIVGRGWTQPGGRPHAETEALRAAGEKSIGATAYVTLEPCAHEGQTPPCAEALIKAGVSRVVVASHDPDARVNGRGIQMLRSAGVEVTTGVHAKDADVLQSGFFSKVKKGRPFVALKFATTLDGRIATSSGESKWITGPMSRAYGHMLRAKFDAILVGVNTVLADNPSLTCRINGLEAQSPVRIILDTHLRTPLGSQLVQTADRVATWIVCKTGKEQSDAAIALQDACVRVIPVPDMRNVDNILKVLADAGITRLLIEGGGTVHASFVKANCADQIYHMLASKLVGGDGLAVIQSLSLAILKDAPHFILQDNKQLGDDLLATYQKAE